MIQIILFYQNRSKTTLRKVTIETNAVEIKFTSAHNSFMARYTEQYLKM